MSVHNEFMIEIYGFMHSLHTFLACVAYAAIDIMMEDSENRK